MEGKKKPIMIAISVGCIALAIVVSVISSSGDKSGAESLERGEIIWVKCSNPDCGVEYQMDTKDFYEAIEKGKTATPLCKDCDEESIYKAIKCEKCGIVFFPSSGRTDSKDRCPECGFSKTEEERAARE